MSEPDHSFDLVSRRSRFVRRVVAALAVAVLGTVAWVIVRLATEDRAVAPCDHLESLDGGTKAIEAIVSYVQTRFVAVGLVASSPLEIAAGGADHRCRAAFHILEHASGNAQFEDKVSCTTAARSARDAIRCFQ